MVCYLSNRDRTMKITNISKFLFTLLENTILSLSEILLYFTKESLVLNYLFVLLLLLFDWLFTGFYSFFYFLHIFEDLLLALNLLGLSLLLFHFQLLLFLFLLSFFLSLFLLSQLLLILFDFFLNLLFLFLRFYRLRTDFRGIWLSRCWLSTAIIILFDRLYGFIEIC